MTTGEKLFFTFCERFLGLPDDAVVGIQRGYRHIPDQLLFNTSQGNTLAVPLKILQMQEAEAKEIVKDKIAASERAFDFDGVFELTPVPGDFTTRALAYVAEALRERKSSFDAEVRSQGVDERRKERPLTASEVAEGQETISATSLI